MEISQIIKGTEPGRSSYCEAPEGTKFIRVGDLTGKSDNPVNTKGKDVVRCKGTDILMSFDGTPGVVALGFEGAISSGIRIVRPDLTKVRNDFLYHYLQSGNVQETIRKHTSGATILHSGKSISFIEIEAPTSLVAQQGIAAKLNLAKETIDLARIQKSKSLDCVRKLRNVIFSRLTEREALSQLTKVIYRYPSFYGFKYSHEGVPVVKIENMTVDGKLDCDLSHYDLIPYEVSKAYPKTIIEPDDVVMGVRGTYIGLSALVPSRLRGGNTSPNLVRIQPDNEKVTGRFLWNALQTEEVRSAIDRTSTFWKVGFGTIKSSKLGEVPIPYASKEDQRNICDVLDTATRSHEMLSENSGRAEALYEHLLTFEFG